MINDNIIEVINKLLLLHLVGCLDYYTLQCSVLGTEQESLKSRL